MTLANPTRSFALSAYNRDAVLLASPAQRLVMLYDRLLLDLARARAAQESGDQIAASAQLVHAQEIVATLAATLKDGLWEGSGALRSLYAYVLQRLVQANLEHSVAATEECSALLAPIRDAWAQAAQQQQAPVSRLGDGIDG